MGCAASVHIIPKASSVKESTKGSVFSTVVFKVLPSETEARRRFEADGTLMKNSDSDQLALRTMLDEPLSQNSLGKFAAKTQSLENFMCWIDIQEYKTIPTDSYRRSKALHIYSKYIKPDAPLSLSIKETDRKKFENLLSQSKTNPSVLHSAMFNSIQNQCFLDMYYNIYLAFKQTDEFQKLMTHLKNKYNHIKINDFEYYNKLGEGKFGFVVHCKKKSTGKHFAMKIQTKKSLLSQFKNKPTRVSIEKDALASLHHPFIVNLNYAFQTPTMVMMVLDLSVCGDLNNCLHYSRDGRLSESRVCFYAAEIILALYYLHQSGLVYCDLKPQNVLLNEDGHIQLVDLGGIVDINDYWLQNYRSNEAKDVPLYTESQFTSSLQYNTHLSYQKVHIELSQSIMGTIGYMAPEMLLIYYQAKILSSPYKSKTKVFLSNGFTQAVDWWSLGITIYKLLTGQRPLRNQKNCEYVDIKDIIQEIFQENLDFIEFSTLFQKIPYPSYVSEEAKDLINGLLNVNEKLRLGYGPEGITNIKKHQFFRGIDWDLLEQKQVEPPYKPESKSFPVDSLISVDFEDVLEYYEKESFMDLDQVLLESEENYFKNWDFIAPQVLRIEAGLSQMMSQLGCNMKARQLIGEY